MPTKRVYVGNLPRDVQKYEVEDLFYDYRPNDVTVKEGFAFLFFDNEDDAHDAIRDLDGQQYVGRRVRVEEAKASRQVGGMRGGRGRSRENNRNERRRPRSPGVRRGDYRVIVEDMPYRASWQDLKDFARDHGCPRPVGTEVYNKNGESIGVLEFTSRQDVEEAIACLDRQKIVPGKGARHHYDATTIRCFEENGSRSRSRDRQRARSYSRSMRRSRSRSFRGSRSRGGNRSPDRDREYSRERERDRRSSNRGRDSIDREYQRSYDQKDAQGSSNIDDPIKFEGGR